MASLQTSFSRVISTTMSYSSSHHRRQKITSTINLPKVRNIDITIPDFTTTKLVEELASRRGYTRTIPNHIGKAQDFRKDDTNTHDPMVIEKLYAIMEVVSDRIEMHKNIGEQRNNWNSLLLTSINTITLTASIITAISAIGASLNTPIVALKFSSTTLYLAATGILVIMNKIQPSQLVEEQRNATRLFNQIHEEILTKVTIGNPSNDDVAEALEKVLALDKAYPLPLLGTMLEKFPERAEPAVWWPERRTKRVSKQNDPKALTLPRKQNDGAQSCVSSIGSDRNGWDDKLEKEMREVVKVMEKNDKCEYLRLGEKALKLHKMLAISGPLLNGLAALGSTLVGQSSWALAIGLLSGALASIVNTLQHGGQIGMVFEMYRSNAGFFNMMGESIESSLEERELSRRENGNLVEMKVALKLGRSLSELKSLATSSLEKGEALEEFACKLF